METTTDPLTWLSAMSSVAAAIIAMATLLTVYIAAVQLASQNRLFKQGLSWRAIGPWGPRVTRSSLLGLRRTISVPSLSLKSLVGNGWKPELVFPAGIPKTPRAHVEEGDNVQARAGWVNFIQALDLSPDIPSDGSMRLYEMQHASELLNGVVPMPWTGKDLVGICSILGFQSHENTNGCVVEFRRRMFMANQISDDIHRHWKGRDLSQEDHFLRSRLWNAIGGFLLPDENVLYLGGIYETKGPRDLEPESQEATDAQLFDDLTSANLTSEEIMLKLFGKKKDRPQALRREADRDNPTQSDRGTRNPDPDPLEALLRLELDKASCGCSGMKELLRPCPGFLSVVINGELAYSRGLSSALDKCKEYDRWYASLEDGIDPVRYPHHLGDLYMDDKILALMKDALLHLCPDGFYFSPTRIVLADLNEAYGHIEQLSNKAAMEIFPTHALTTPPPETPQDAFDDLLYSLDLCNDLQCRRKTGYAMLSVEDMRLLAKASYSLKPIISPAGGGGRDLIWAMICCPDLPRDICSSLAPTKSDITGFLAARFVCRSASLRCAYPPDLLRGSGGAGPEKDVDYYAVPLVADGEFTGTQILAALAYVFITYYWINKAWATNVALYDSTMPQNVLMC
ncbi:uncharacterized protein C8A04DRAFT_27171 [Dichotomopilus funicola]|uniref:Uncharacterized protein n=1 Tax=Dichotomopilus funicola TaxID=1934379 RepID=A0AAN6V5L3_9PEZI|nr:hypothetical protein C8A04DRAFT_27171 [Dichotomopilus funicola]